ncbi:DMT family transporter [Onishia taeanensis]
MQLHSSTPGLPRRLPLGTLSIAAGFVLCWSSGFVGSRLAVAVDTPVLALYAWRFALATLIGALIWAAQAGPQGLRATLAWRALGREAAIGSLTVGLYLLAMLVAVEQGVSAGVASLVGALQPLAAAGLAAWWLGEASGRGRWIGMGVATLGAGLCVLDDVQGVGGAPAWAYALPVLAVAAVTLGSVMTSAPTVKLPLMARLTAQLAAATLVFFAAALTTGSPLTPPAMDAETLTVMAWLVGLATFGGYGFFVVGLGRLGVARLSTLIYLTPAVTLGFTAVLFDELPGTLGWLGMAVASLGVLMALSSRARTSARAGRGGDAPAAVGASHGEAAQGALPQPLARPVGEAQASRAKIRSQTPWPSRSPRASNLVSGRKSGRGT